MKNKYYITTPIYYVNDKPHLGHAYTSLVADTVARYKKLFNKDVFFITGTDEHGQKVEEAAKKKNTSPKEFVDKVSKQFVYLTELLKLTNNDFIRTSEDCHKEYVKAVWTKLEKLGDIYLDTYKGWYSITDESFVADNEITTDKKNQKIGPSGDILQWLEEPSYFFRLSKWQDKLLEFYSKNPDFVKPKSRYNEVIKFVEKGLQDLSISRTSFSWGINVPGSSNHIIYVWLDALFNYISVLTKNNKFDNYWPADAHIVGKDILRFHAIFWPAFLLSANLKLPKKVFAHGWWTIDGEKMSKSLGNVIDPVYLVEKYGVDQIRYFLLREIPFGEDGNFSELSLIKRLNSDLTNDLGNLIQSIVFSSIKLDRNLYKDNKVKLATTLNVLVNTIFKINILIQPFLPISAKKVFHQLNVQEFNDFTCIKHEIKVGSKINKPEGVFPRI